ncbi:MAG: ferrous iron transport protein A [Alcaligenaceae bacterium]|nr:MAG: ferrous iron transport protein A [Alcaligenaceae bacterium]
MQLLHTAQVGQLYRIAEVRASVLMPDCDRQLNELGFLIGEQVMVLRRSMPGADPLVVRIGMSTFALRAAEAALVGVQNDQAYAVAQAAARA